MSCCPSPQYLGSVDEGAVDLVVMRLKAFDVDLVDSDNWLAVFNIVAGNEEGLFTIHTDPKTNEGILKLVKVGLQCFLQIFPNRLQYLCVYKYVRRNFDFLFSSNNT